MTFAEHQETVLPLWREKYNHMAQLQEAERRLALLVQMNERLTDQQMWYNERVGVLEDIYYRLGEHVSQGRLDSDVWYKLTRLRHDG